MLKKITAVTVVVCLILTSIPGKSISSICLAPPASSDVSGSLNVKIQPDASEITFDTYQIAVIRTLCIWLIKPQALLFLSTAFFSIHFIRFWSIILLLLYILYFMYDMFDFVKKNRVITKAVKYKIFAFFLMIFGLSTIGGDNHLGSDLNLKLKQQAGMEQISTQTMISHYLLSSN